MISSVMFHETAELELLEAAKYYESNVKGLGRAFIKEVERIIRQIRQHPESAPCILKVVRRIVLRRFPFSVMYSVKDNTICILAIAHHKRRPFYWRERY